MPKKQTSKKAKPLKGQPPRRLALVPGSPLVACECCKGAGKVPLQRDLLRTFQHLETERPLMVSELRENGVTPNAINNRLVKLEQLGLARRRGKCGKWVMWFRANDQSLATAGAGLPKP
jgi:predicted methyltransferase